MPVKRKVTKKKKSIGSSIGSYVRKLMSAPVVKRASLTIKELEKKLLAAKKKKAAAVKITRKKLKK
jgi:hypothetical protein